MLLLLQYEYELQYRSAPERLLACSGTQRTGGTFLWKADLASGNRRRGSTGFTSNCNFLIIISSALQATEAKSRKRFIVIIVQRLRDDAVPTRSPQRRSDTVNYKYGS